MEATWPETSAVMFSSAAYSKGALPALAQPSTVTEPVWLGVRAPGLETSTVT